MTDAAPVVTPRRLDALRRWRRDPGSVAPEERAELGDAGLLNVGRIPPEVAVVVDVWERSWATVRVRRWRDGERVDLVAAVGPGGVAVLVGPPGPDAELRCHHRPRWTGLARTVAAHVGLGPVAPGGTVELPASAPWADLVAAAGPAPPPWADGAGGVVTLWDLARSTGRRLGDRRLTVLDLGGAALAEARPQPDAAEAVVLTPRRPDEVWLGLCHLVADLVPRGTQGTAAGPGGGRR